MQDMLNKILNARNFPKGNSILKGWRLRLFGVCGGNGGRSNGGSSAWPGNRSQVDNCECGLIKSVQWPR